MNSLHAHLTRRTFLGGAVAFGAVGLIAPKVAFAEPETSSDVQAKADAARQKLNEMRLQLGVASDTYNQALEDHDTALSKMDEAQTKIDENNVRIAELQERLGGRARSMYRNGQTTFLDIVLGSASFDDFLKNWDSLNMLNDEDAKLVSETKTLREDNEAQKAEYSAQADTAKQKMDEAQAAKTEAESLVSQYQDEVDSLDAEVAALLEEEKKAAEEAAVQAAAATGTDASSEAESDQDSSSDGAGSQGEESGGSTGGGSTEGSTGGGSTGGSSTGGSAGGSTGGSTGGFTGGSAGGSTGGSTGGSSGGGSTGGSTGGTGGGNSYGSAIVGAAQSQLGVPYVWGGTTPGVGLDCSGLTSYCWQAGAGIWIGRNTTAQYASAQWVGSVGQAQPGDVLYTSGHVAIAASSGGYSYIHAPQPGEVVCYSSRSWWDPFTAALRWY